MTKKCKVAICAATPFQTLNAINLAVNVLNDGYEIDLFFRDFREDTHSILNELSKYDFFSNIYVYDLRNKNEGLSYYLNDVEQGLMPKRFIEGLMKTPLKLATKKYDVITVTSGTELEVAFTRVFPRARIIAYDDGLGSYIGDIIHDHKLNIIWRLMGRTTKNIWPECLYVNNDSFCESKLSTNILQLPSLESQPLEYKEIIFSIFGAKKTKIYESKKYVYLTQPLTEIGNDAENVNKMIEQIIEKSGNEAIYRKHPRDFHEINISIDEDRTGCLWELICNSQITDNSVLIGICSTAQIMPKIIYDKEPKLIFLYKLFDFEDSSVVEKRFEPIVKKISSIYRKKNQIVIPSNLTELEALLL